MCRIFAAAVLSAAVLLAGTTSNAQSAKPSNEVLREIGEVRTEAMKNCGENKTCLATVRAAASRAFLAQCAELQTAPARLRTPACDMARESALEEMRQSFP